jgi:hypothetical protein
VRGEPALPVPEPRPRPQQQPLKVVVQGVDGAPGDGTRSLPRALRAILVQQKIAVVDKADGDTVLVRGAVQLEERGAEQLVEIKWSVARPDGKRLGQVSQSNLLPKGLLDRAWGDIAYAAAEGGAAGILEVLAKLPAGAATAN